ncbi:hypothetical protein HHUSO_G2490, partial [Huso huso]
PQRKKASCLSQSLKGTAAEVLLDLGPEERVNYPVLVDALKCRFGDSKSPYRLQDQLRSRCRARGEKLGTLAADIARLSRKAYRDEPTSFSKRIALDTFLHSLQPPELRHQVRLKRPSTLKEALAYAQSIEEVLLDEESLPRHLTSK